ncbi:flagellar FlhE, partial [Halobacillus litoralis]|nr:flagellar FlhE [Halobacillus litoralis]
CTALTGMRGSTQAFAGERASESLHFRFTLPAGEPPVRVQGMQVIVNYQ